MPQSCINNLINVWQRETILWACLIQVSKVYANPPFASIFRHNYHIG